MRFDIDRSTSDLPNYTSPNYDSAISVEVPSSTLQQIRFLYQHIRLELKITNAPTKCAVDCILVGAPASRRELKITNTPTKWVADCILVGAPASRRELKFVNAPTKKVADCFLVGAPASRRELEITNAPTKWAADCILVGAPATRRELKSLMHHLLRLRCNIRAVSVLNSWRPIQPVSFAISGLIYG